MTAKERQEFTRRPLTWTVQAPHWPWSQPSWCRAGAGFAQGVEQGGAGVDVELAGFAVDLEREGRDGAGG